MCKCNRGLIHKDMFSCVFKGLLWEEKKPGSRTWIPRYAAEILTFLKRCIKSQSKFSSHSGDWEGILHRYVLYHRIQQMFLSPRATPILFPTCEGNLSHNRFLLPSSNKSGNLFTLKASTDWSQRTHGDLIVLVFLPHCRMKKESCCPLMREEEEWA